MVKQRASVTKTKRPVRKSIRIRRPTAGILPYIQIGAIAIAGLVLGMQLLPSRRSHQVLAYATDVSTAGLLTETNAQRTEHKVSPLQLNDKLTQAAQAKATDMAAKNYWSHVTPSGQEPWVFLDQAGYSYKKAGENLAYGFSTSKTAILGWMNSASHRDNMLDSAYQEVGFGFANANNYQSGGPSTIVVAMYGERLSATTAGVNGDSTSLKVPLATTQRIADIQLLTKGQAPWSATVLLIITFSVLSIALYKHSRALRRAIGSGERFVTHHIALDVIVIALVIGYYVTAGLSGYIL